MSDGWRRSADSNEVDSDELDVEPANNSHEDEGREFKEANVQWEDFLVANMSSEKYDDECDYTPSEVDMLSDTEEMLKKQMIEVIEVDNLGVLKGKKFDMNWKSHLKKNLRNVLGMGMKLILLMKNL
ncbi:hypothetical protein V2J09_021381 [Rumex salicifolius]